VILQVHEFGHGIANRLTGGRTNVGCLGWGEAGGGISEGGGDFLATAFRTNVNSTRNDNYVIGKYSFDNPAGIRTYPVN